MGRATKKVPRAATEQRDLRWLLKFITTDLNALSETRLKKLSRELGRISLHGGSVARPSEGARARSFQMLILPMRKELGFAQSRLREGLDALMPPDPQREPQEWFLSMGESEVILVREGSAISRRFAPAGPQAELWLGVSSLFERYGTSIRRCPECKTLFLRSRRQEYCSSRCSQKVRSRRWYATHREEALEKRHDAYKTSVKREHPRAKVTRRLRRLG